MTKKELEKECERLRQKVSWLEKYMYELLAQSVKMKSGSPISGPLNPPGQINIPSMWQPACSHPMTINGICQTCGQYVQQFQPVITTSGTDIKVSGNL